MFDTISSGPFTMSNIYMTNYTNAGGSSISPIELIPGPTTNIQLSGIHMNSFEHHDVPFMSVLGSANEIMIKDCSLNSAKIPSEGYLFYALGINSFSITNLTVQNTTSIDESDGDSVYLNIASLNIGNMATAQISQVEISNSSFSLFKINTFINITDNSNPFTIESIKYTDSIIQAKRVLISTKRISMNTNLLISLSNVTFENIEYTNTGTLLEIMHQLPTNITLSDSIFNNIISGLISIEGSQQTEDLSTLFLISNCSFANIRSSVNTFIEVKEKTEVVIERSSFTNLTLTTFISGIMNIYDGAKVTVLHSTLTKNSATVSSIAKIEANALLTIDN